ncbi:hypothetical protein [Flavobacterium sp.]|uniref:hypothetical protein n=1 Tax=Flavobacterium sp. TaxID=239 RepID=UPI0025BCA02D|nr:hypothetical protein [Flavobacterium sp.]MBA4155067.1 hypothetical protein [Flavobacterium sp.]
MGKLINSLERLLLSRPKMDDYLSMLPNEKDFIDDVIKNYVKPNSILRTKKHFFLRKNVEPKSNDFWKLSWNDILMIRNGFKKNNLYDVLKILYPIDEKQFLKLEILNVFACYKYITEQMQKLEAAELERLNSEIKDEDKMAGAEELLEYGYYNSLRAICPDLTKQEEYLKLPYTIIFRELAISKLINDINLKKQENASRKNQTNGR